MRTLELIRVLTDRELGEFEELMKIQKRKSLQLVYEVLKKYRKRNDTPDNEELYQRVFEKKYTSDKNYLLRNELRLLNDILYEFLIEKTFSGYIKKHKSTYYAWLARTFFERKLTNAFDADIDRFIEYTKEYVKPEDGGPLNDLKSLSMIYTQEKTAANLQQQMAAVEQWIQEQIRHTRYRLREMESRHAYLQRTLRGIEGSGDEGPDDQRTEAKQLIDLSAGEKNDKFEEYLILKKHSYQTYGKVRVSVLKQMLAFEESGEYRGETSALDVQCSSLNAIGLELILSGHFTEADEYLLESMKRREENNQPVFSSTVQNYIGNQLNHGSYQRGIDLYKKYEEQITGYRQYIPISLYKANCHLFLGQDDEALDSLPKAGPFTEHQQLMFRMIYLIAFIIRKQFELAINECNNIGRMIKTRETGHAGNYEWINNWFAKYLAAIGLSGKQRKTALQNLKAEMKRSEERLKQLMITEFALRWLVEEIDKR